jgi:hypothetical protein
MPFIGKNPTSGFSTIVKDDLTPDGSTTAFTLSKQVASANDIAVFVGNVRQEPTDAYSVSGTTLTMTAAPASGVNFYVLHIAGTLESSVIPADNTISTAKIQNNAITMAKLATSGTLPALDGSALTGLGFTTAEIDLTTTQSFTGLPSTWSIMHISWYDVTTSNSGQYRMYARVGGSQIGSGSYNTGLAYWYSTGSATYSNSGGANYGQSFMFWGSWGTATDHTGNAIILRNDNGSDYIYTLTAMEHLKGYSTYGGVAFCTSQYDATAPIDGLTFEDSAGSFSSGKIRIVYQ